MTLELGADELLTTTRAVRRRLDLERPIERALVEACLHIAFQAPNGSNQQRYDWLLVDDAGLRAEMAAIYRAGLADRVEASRAERGGPAATESEAQARMSASVHHLLEHLHEVPVLVVPTIGGRLEGASVFEQASLWGSVLPAVWSFMLALRARGLGSAWTTVHLYREAEMAELLGIPGDRVTQVGLFPVAYTIGTDFRPADRSKSASSIHWNHW